MTEAEIEAFVEESLRPKVRVDGGDIRFAELDGETVVVDAYADCATCPAADEGLVWWLGNELSARFGRALAVRLRKHPPYFTG